MSRFTAATTLLLLLGTAPACTPMRPTDPTPPLPTAGEQSADQHGATVNAPPPESSTTPPTAELPAEAIPGEISRLGRISQNSSAGPAEKAESLRRLALLHLSPQNPARDLELAAAAQAAYVETLSPGLLRQEGEIWLALINTAREDEQLQRRQAANIHEKDKALAALGAEKQRLLQKITGLEASNTKLKGDIEKLKFIDLSMEKKRQVFR